MLFSLVFDDGRKLTQFDFLTLLSPQLIFIYFLFGLPIFRYGYGGMRVCVVQTGLTDVHHVHTYVYELPV